MVLIDSLKSSSTQHDICSSKLWSNLEKNADKATYVLGRSYPEIALSPPQHVLRFLGCKPEVGMSESVFLTSTQNAAVLQCVHGHQCRMRKKKVVADHASHNLMCNA